MGSSRPVRLHLEWGVPGSLGTALIVAHRHHTLSSGQQHSSPCWAFCSLPTHRLLDNELDNISLHHTELESSPLQFGKGKHQIGLSDREDWDLCNLFSICRCNFPWLWKLLLHKHFGIFPLKQRILLCWISINGTRIWIIYVHGFKFSNASCWWFKIYLADSLKKLLCMQWFI